MSTIKLETQKASTATNLRKTVCYLLLLPLKAWKSFPKTYWSAACKGNVPPDANYQYAAQPRTKNVMTKKRSSLPENWVWASQGLVQIRFWKSILSSVNLFQNCCRICFARFMLCTLPVEYNGTYVLLLIEYLAHDKLSKMKQNECSISGEMWLQIDIVLRATTPDYLK